MTARNIIDYAYNDQGKELRDALYASIFDKVNTHIEQKKIEIAQGLVAQEQASVAEAKECECDDDEKEDKEEGHEDEKEDKAMIKKMVKKDALKTEELKGDQHKIDKNKNGKIDADDFKKLRKEEVEELDESTRKHFQMVADLIKSHEDHDKRKELAQHHATVFALQNPRFDRAKFMKAANVQE
jgi:hypothetical protein